MKTKTCLILLPLFLLLTSCIEFERQTLTFQHDAANDRLLIFQEYEGIYGYQNEEAKFNEQEISQLASVLDRQRTFFFANWIFEYDEENIQKILDKEPPAKDPEFPLKTQLFSESQQLARLLLENVNVQNGAFYFDAEQKLCGYQKICISQVSRIMAQINQLLRTNVRNENKLETLSAESKDLLLKAAESGFDFLRLEGNELSFSGPLAYADLQQVRSGWVKEIREVLGQEAEQTKKLEGFAQLLANDIWFDYSREGVASLRVGNPGLPQCATTLAINDAYQTNAVAHVKATYGIEDSVDIPAIKAQFFGE